MNRTLKVDPDFCPIAVRDGDELFPNGIFVFNISRMLEYLQAESSGAEPIEIDVKELPPQFSTIDETALGMVDLDCPVVLAEIAPGRYNLIDGHHRAEKARRDGVRTLKAYQTYVEYWNGRLRELKRTERQNRR